jgi:hypothetical protein
MRLVHGVLTVTLALIAAFTLAPARADSTDDDIKAMLELAAAGKDDECVAKMDLVRAGREKRAYVALHELAASAKSDKVACGAIRALVVGWRDADTFRWLVGKIGDKTLYDTPGRPDLYRCVLSSMRDFPPERTKQALTPLADAVNRFMATNPEYADLAIRAYGTVPDRFTVQQLLKWLDQAGAPPDAKAGKDAKENKEKAKTSVLQTLAKLCAHEEADAAAWKKWWEANAKTFKFPEAAKPGEPEAGPAKPAAAGADPSGLSEFKDETYGWSVKRPEADYWKFMLPDYKGPRVALRCGGVDGMGEFARAYFSVHDPTQSEPRDVASFAKWVIDNRLKSEVPADGIIQAPSTKTVTANGIEWTVVSARGLGGAGWSNWGSIERRCYIAKLGAKILYVDVFVSLSADAEDKTAMWSCIEGITLTAK